MILVDCLLETTGFRREVTPAGCPSSSCRQSAEIYTRWPSPFLRPLSLLKAKWFHSVCLHTPTPVSTKLRSIMKVYFYFDAVGWMTRDRNDIMLHQSPKILPRRPLRPGLTGVVAEITCRLNTKKQAVGRRPPRYGFAPCKLTISSYLFVRWHLFRHVGYLRHQQQVDL